MTAIAPVVLQDSNHTNIHLAPLPVVARVVTPVASPQIAVNLANEIAVAQHLAQGSAPVVGPTVDVAPGPYSEGDALVTLWQFVSHHPADEADAVAAAEALAVVHGILATYPGQLPSFTAAIDSCRAMLQDTSALPALRPADKVFLLEQHDRLRELLGKAALNRAALHGDAHLGNVLVTARGPQWADWESSCMGPTEWDLASLPEPAWAVFKDVDYQPLALLRDLRSVCVAVWCWAEPDRAPEKRAAAEFHLRRLREQTCAA